MSLVVTVFVPTGIVMAADTRMTLTYQEKRKESDKDLMVEHQIVISDNARKLGILEAASVGVSTFGASILDDEPVGFHVRKFAETSVVRGDSVESVAHKLIAHFRGHFPDVSLGFHVCGFQKEDEESIPYVYFCHTIQEPVPKRWNADDKGNIKYGLIRSGDTHVIDRLLSANSLPLFSAMLLPDAVDYASYLVRTTIETLRFEPKFPSVGGKIDVLLITPHRIRFIQRRQINEAREQREQEG